MCVVPFKMKNEYQKYWIVDEKEWHENEIGIYHISTIGISHQDFINELKQEDFVSDKVVVVATVRPDDL